MPYQAIISQNIHYINKLPCKITRPGIYILNTDGYGYREGTAVIIKANNVILDGYNHTIVYWECGIYVETSHNTVIKNVNIKNNGFGIFLNKSSSSIIEYNSIESNQYEGIYFEASSNNTIKNNIIERNAGNGIHLSCSSNNSIENNNIKENRWNGILFGASSNNRIKNNDFVEDGLFIFNSYKNYVKNNTVNEKPLVYLEEESNKVIKEAGQVLLVNCTGITVKNLNLSSASVGIELWNTKNSILGNNIVKSNYYGIYIMNSSGNEIESNNIENNKWAGIHLELSFNNIINNNIIENNRYEGIDLEDSSNNKIENNRIKENKKYGIFISGSNNIVVNNIIKNNWHGITIGSFSNNNTIKSNNIEDNNYGVSLWSSNNLIYYNNFLNNHYQAKVFNSRNIWDDRHKGNYWSDYKGKDSNNDGIGDVPYIINKYNVDHYPLMKPIKIEFFKEIKPREIGILAIKSVLWYEYMIVIICIISIASIYLWHRRKH